MNKPFSKPSLQDPMVELDWNTGNALSTEENTIKKISNQKEKGQNINI